MADLDPAAVLAIEDAVRIVAAEAARPLPAAESCACWADMMARRAAAEDADDMRREADRG